MDTMGSEVEMELEKFNLEELKVVAEKLEISFPGNITDKTLKSKIEAHIAENPDCIKDEAVEKTLDSNTEDQLAKMEALEDTIAKATAERDKIDKSAEISMTSIFRGVIDTSVGSIDFGTEGKATVTARQAKFLKTMKGYELC